MIAATLSGPTYGTRTVNDETTIEVFPHLGDAMLAMVTRQDSNRYTSVRLLNGEIHMLLPPLFGRGATLTCYEIGGELGDFPTEEQVMEALTSVHIGVFQYRLTLTADADGNPAVSVQMGAK